MCATVIIWSILSCIHLLSPPQTLASYWPPCSNSTIATSPSISPTDAPMIPGTNAMGLWANSWLYCQSVLHLPTARILTLMQILQFSQKLSIPWHIFYLLWICVSGTWKEYFSWKISEFMWCKCGYSSMFMMTQPLWTESNFSFYRKTSSVKTNPILKNPWLHNAQCGH